MKKPIKTCNKLLPFTPTGAFAWANFSAGRCGGFFLSMSKKAKPKEYLKMRLSLLDSIDFLDFRYQLEIEQAEALLIIYRAADWVHRIGKHGMINAKPEALDIVCGKQGVARAFIERGWIKMCERGFYFSTKFPCCPAYTRKIFSEKFRKQFMKAKSCVKCQSLDFLEIDHIVPVSAGGSHEIENLQVLCRSCNRKKSSKTGEKHGR